jgi:hypothetical protein
MLQQQAHNLRQQGASNGANSLCLWPDDPPMSTAQASLSTRNVQPRPTVIRRDHGEHQSAARTTHAETKAAIQSYCFRHHGYWHHVAGRWPEAKLIPA